MKNIKSVFRIANNQALKCPACDHHFKLDKMDENINHLLQYHKGKLIAIHSEAKLDDGNLITVAFIGFSE